MVPESNSTHQTSEYEAQHDIKSDFNHPACHSLVAHLSRTPAWKKKEELEQYLVEETLNRCDQIDREKKCLGEDALQRIQSDREVQKALIIASYSGCNLVYSPSSSPDSPPLSN